MRTLERWFDVQQWLVREAKLLDARRYDAWLALLHPDVRYRMPDRSYRVQVDPGDFATWSVDCELGHPQGLALINDDLQALTLRIGRLQTKMAWAEMPASMSRRMVGNVTVDADDGDVVSVSSTLFLAKARQTERVMLTAERRDRLAAADDGYRLLERFVVLDAVELPAENLSLLF